MARAPFSIWVSILLAGGLPLAAEATPLIDAVKRQDVVTANALLDRGADVNAAEGDGATALHWAAQLDDPTMVDLLLESGAAADCGEPLQRHTARARELERQSRHRRAPARRRRRRQCALAGRTHAAHERRAQRPRRGRRGAARARRGGRRRGELPRADRTHAGRGRRQRRSDARAHRRGRERHREIEVGVHAAAVRRAQRTARRAALAARPRRERERSSTRRHERAQRGRSQRVLRSSLGAARPRRGPESPRRARLTAPHDRLAAQTRRRPIAPAAWASSPPRHRGRSAK